MEKQKTALQIAIEEIENIKGQRMYINRKATINLLKSLLPTERGQIERAYKDGVIDGYANDSLSKETYFTDNFQE